MQQKNYYFENQRPLTIYVKLSETIFVKTRAVAIDHLCYARVSRLKSIKLSSEKLFSNVANDYNAMHYSYFRHS